ncbi:MAG: hypothetical protein ACPL25_04990 [Ignavibacteria bacterium]
MKQRAFNPHRNQSLLPAKKITDDELVIKEIILYRIENGFYDQKKIQSKVIEKLLDDLLEIKTGN